MWTHSKVIEVVGPVAQLLVCPTLGADVGRAVVLSLVGQQTVETGKIDQKMQISSDGTDETQGQEDRGTGQEDRGTWDRTGGQKDRGQDRMTGGQDRRTGDRKTGTGQEDRGTGGHSRPAKSSQTTVLQHPISVQTED